MNIHLPGYPAIVGFLFSLYISAQDVDIPVAIDNKEINPGNKFKVLHGGKRIRVKSHADGSFAFDTEAGGLYTLVK